MKIALIDDHYTGTGIHSYTRELYRNLVGHGVQAKFYQFGGPGAIGAIKAVVVPRLKRPDLRGQIVHISNPNLGFISGAIMTVHDLYYLRYRSNSRAWSYYCKASYGHIRKARWIVANSRSTKEEVKREFGVDNISVVYPSIAPEFTPGTAELCPGRKALLHVGHDMPNKNIRSILMALKKLPESYSLVRVGQDSVELKREIRALGLELRYRNIAAGGPAELAAIYRGSFALVFPSLYEGFGIPPVEAMACGTPVISSDRGGLKESSAGSSLIIDPEDSQTIADAVLALEDASLRERLVQKGRERASMFSRENQFRQVMSAYSAIEP
ncbi:MAG: glycosyltransferase family 4 protein [Nitrososphaerota archaeon]|nr:glycosyltransferase family 4 protein [Nitrososphaerota archaeon]